MGKEWSKVMYPSTKSPCTRECQDRTVTCKFDGSCDKYVEWKARIEELKQNAFNKDGQYHDYLRYKKAGQ